VCLMNKTRGRRKVLIIRAKRQVGLAAWVEYLSNYGGSYAFFCSILKRKISLNRRYIRFCAYFVRKVMKTATSGDSVGPVSITARSQTSFYNGELLSDELLYPLQTVVMRLTKSRVI
jgi:hypothetical protein